MPQDVFAVYNSLSVAQKQEVHDFMMFLSTRGYAAVPEKKSATNFDKSPQRIPGTLKGKIKMSDDFDSPLECFKECM